MTPFEVIADPVRRRVLELLAGGERTSGSVVEAIQAEFGITQAAVSQHLKVLRENGFAAVREEGTRRLYSIAAEPFAAIDAWLAPFRGFWVHRLEALATEVARGKKVRRRRAAASRPGGRSGTDG